ncbi:MAG: Fur family transcriptional regulator [Candidatus Binatia bacterium]
MKRDAQAAVLSEELSSRGLRATRQRLALLRLLRAADYHPTALDLHRALLREQKRVSKKTVYEVLGAFVREGLAACVTEGGEPFRYESTTDPHYHARCRICARIFDLPARANSQIRGLANPPEGFQVESIGVTMRGVCMRCRDDV